MGHRALRRAGDALGDLVDPGPRSPSVSARCRVAGRSVRRDRAADLLGPSAPDRRAGGRCPAGRARIRTSVAIGAFKCRDFIGHKSGSPARAMARSAPIAHGSDFTADRLTNRHHRIAGGPSGSENGGDRPSIARSTAFLATPAGSQMETNRTGTRNSAARPPDAARPPLSPSRGLKRGQEADGRENAGRRSRGRRPQWRTCSTRRAGRPLLNGLKKSGRWFRGRRSRRDGECVTSSMGSKTCRSPAAESMKARCGQAWQKPVPRRRGPIPRCSGSGNVADVQGFLDRRSATSVGSLTFLGLFAMFSLSPRLISSHPGQVCARAGKLEAGVIPRAAPKRPHGGRLVRSSGEHPIGSGGANEMAAINTILIIVNSAVP